MRLYLAFAAVLTLAGCTRAPTLTDIGPRMVSNQTSQPLALVGTDFKPGMELVLGPPLSRKVAVTTIDATHAYARLPGDLALGAASDAQAVDVKLAGALPNAPSLRLRVVNDAAFPELTALVASGRALFAVSPTTDSLYRIDLADGHVRALPAGDGPAALAAYTTADGAPMLAIAHTFEPTIWICDGATGAKTRVIKAPAYASALAADGDAFIIAEQATDTVRKLAMSDGAVRWTTPVDPNPKSMTIAAGDVAVGSALTGRIETLSRESGQSTSTIAPTPETRIVGGHTEPFAGYIMGGKAQRGLVWLEKAQRLLAANIGPNIGPNPDKMEVSMNGGVSVVAGGKVVTHLGFGFGVPQALAADEATHLLYVADVATGLLRVVDLEKLFSDDPKTVAQALLWSVPIPQPLDFPLTRPVADFSVSQRSGVELHSGPQALALAGTALYVLNRFSGTLAVIDVRNARTKAPSAERQIPVVTTLGQRERRLGEILYFTDLGRTGMSCDSCHPEGHGDSVLFEKTHPLRIYRVPTIRAAAESPPYFVPASTFSIAETNRKVGDRNRFQNPVQTPDEVAWLTIFASEMASLPNPFVLADGAPPEALVLPDGKIGHPRKGLALFEGKAACSSCHPAPYFTTDQTPATRNRFIEVGTPHRVPLREDMQSDFFTGFSIPALIGTWDVWPMLNTGLAGYDVDRTRGVLEVRDRFALRAVIERFSGPQHGNAAALTADEVNDVLAYLLTL